MSLLDLAHSNPLTRAISPYLEMGAYEALWAENGASFKTISEKFQSTENALPSDFVPIAKAKFHAEEAVNMLTQAGVTNFGVHIHGGGEYPLKLRVAKHPTELIYYQGWWDLIYSECLVAVVGTRNPSKEGLARTRRLVRALVSDGATIVSGLAKGIDREAHSTCIAEGGRTVAVLGTPLTRSYPRENIALQKQISDRHLLVSQVPIKRYEMQVNPTHNRHFFPQRNIMMSALTKATVIVEAGETSGTLVQAKAAIEQGRLLFILDSCFENPKLSWPEKFEKLGAIRVRDYSDIRHKLFSKAPH